MTDHSLSIARAPLALAACLTSLVLGTGAIGHAQASKSGDDDLNERIVNVKNQIQQLELELQRLEIKRSELSLKERAQESRDPITSGSQLLKSLPINAFPKQGESGQIERVATLRWIRQNLPGNRVGWSAMIDKVRIEGEGPYRVSLFVDRSNDFGPYVNSETVVNFGLGPSFVLGDTTCRVVLAPLNRLPEVLEYEKCTNEEAMKLRSFEGKQVALEAFVVSKQQLAKASERAARRGDMTFFPERDHEVGFPSGMLFQRKGDASKEIMALPIKIVVSPPWVDGFLPGKYQEMTRAINGE